MNIFYQPLISNGVLELSDEESRHCIKVLRKRKGNTIHLTDGSGKFYNAIITSEDPKRCTFEITQTIPALAREHAIHVAISPTKSPDRIEWFVEKAVELGVDVISLMECRNTERSFMKTDRLQKVAISAMKQSVKATLPLIQGILKFDAVIAVEAQQKFIAHVDASNPLHLQDCVKPNQSYIILIGPEGDFDAEELQKASQKGFVKVSLGKSRLRTETAGLAACHILNLANS